MTQDHAALMPYRAALWLRIKTSAMMSRAALVDPGASSA
jgi:hypothetical protein